MTFAINPNLKIKPNESTWNKIDSIYICFGYRLKY